MPDLNGIVPTIFSVASSMIQYWLGYAPMISVPLPAVFAAAGLPFCACTSAAHASTATPRTIASFFMIFAYILAGPQPRSLMPRPQRSKSRCELAWPQALREDEVDLAPVLLGGRALRGPVRRVIQLVGHLRRPVAADVAVEEIPLDRLTESRGAARAVRFPAWRKHQRAPDRKMRRLRQAGPLQRDDIGPLGRFFDAHRLAVHWFEMRHFLLSRWAPP